MKIALASPPLIGSIKGALPWVERFVAEAAGDGAMIICFPETCIPGIRGQGFVVDDHDPEGLGVCNDNNRRVEIVFER